MTIEPDDELSGRHECRDFGSHSRRNTSGVVNEVVARDDWFWIVTEEIETEYHAVLARPRFKIPSAIQQDFKAFIEAVTSSYFWPHIGHFGSKRIILH